MPRSNRNRHRYAAELAIAKLEAIPGGRHHAESVRSLLRAFESSSVTNSQLHADNMKLRAKLTPIARAREAEAGAA